MERRKKKYSSRMNQATPKEAISRRRYLSRPFEFLWSVSKHQNRREYDALLDENASYYFTSSSLLKHCRELQKVTHSQEKSRNNLALEENLMRKRAEQNKIFANSVHKSSILRNENNKIKPYASSLKACSRTKLQEMKKNLEQKLLVQERQHQQLISTGIGPTKRQRPLIKVVSTLEPIENLSFMKKCQGFWEEGKKVTVLVRPRNSKSVNV